MFQFVVPPQAVTPPAMVAQVQSPPPPAPDLSGFQKQLQVQPVLAQHGFGDPAAVHRLQRGTVSFRAAVRDSLPDGWQLYAKPGVTLRLPIVVSGAMTKESWTQVLREELREAGLHGAIWWDQQILTVWPAPARSAPARSAPAQEVSVPRVTDTVPKLQGFSRESLVRDPHAATSLPSAGAGQDSIPLPMPPKLSAIPVFTLTKGQLILTDLQQWAGQSGWTVVWQVPEDWEVPNTTSFSGNFQQSGTQVVQALAINGANIHAVFHPANNTVVISGAGGGNG